MNTKAYITQKGENKGCVFHCYAIRFRCVHVFREGTVNRTQSLSGCFLATMVSCLVVHFYADVMFSQSTVTGWKPVSTPSRVLLRSSKGASCSGAHRARSRYRGYAQQAPYAKRRVIFWVKNKTCVEDGQISSTRLSWIRNIKHLSILPRPIKSTMLIKKMYPSNEGWRVVRTVTVASLML